MSKDQVEILRTKIFLKFNRISYTDLAERIDQLARAEGEASSTARQEVYAVVVGRTKTPRIRKYLAQLLDASPEKLWPETSSRKRSKRGDRIPSPESSSIPPGARGSVAE